MEIKVLGPGCANCHKMEELARTAVSELGIEAKIEKITRTIMMICASIVACSQTYTKSNFDLAITTHAGFIPLHLHSSRAVVCIISPCQRSGQRFPALPGAMALTGRAHARGPSAFLAGG